MPNSGDVVFVELGLPAGREAGFRHPAVIVTAQAILDSAPSVVQVVPATSTLRGFESEVVLEPDLHSGLGHRSAAQCQHVRSVSTVRLGDPVGNVGPLALTQIRETLSMIFGITS
jgi:mRNA interferase MazF